MLLQLVPLLVQICVSVVEANGLDTVGIYRIPGNTAAVNALKETLSHCLDTMTLESVSILLCVRFNPVNFK